MQNEIENELVNNEQTFRSLSLTFFFVLISHCSGSEVSNTSNA